MSKPKHFNIWLMLFKHWVRHPIRSYKWYRLIGGSKAFKVKIDLAKSIKRDHDRHVDDYLEMQKLPTHNQP